MESEAVAPGFVAPEDRSLVGQAVAFFGPLDLALQGVEVARRSHAGIERILGFWAMPMVKATFQVSHPGSKAR
jgi:hypothetical protein